MATITPLAPVPAGSALKPVPGDTGLPLIGNTLPMMRDPVTTLRQRYDRFGPVSWTHLFGLKMVQMLGPDANQFVLMNRGDLFSNHQGWSYFIGPFFHRGIMLLDFEEHRWHRRIMQQAFQREALRGYLLRMAPRTEEGLRHWSEGSVKLLPALKQLTLDLATDVFMGRELGDQTDRINRAFIDTVRAGTSLIRFPVPGLGWSKGLRGRRVLERLFMDDIGAKRTAPDSDLFSMLCQARTEDGHEFSDEDVVSHMIFLMMAAHDTTTITLCTLLYHLAREPQWQERLREESLALGKPWLEHEDLDKLPGIGMAMKEALRLCAPVPSMPRRTVKDVEYDGFYIPAGTFINIAPFFTHSMEEYWPDPERFDPERFSDARREDRIHPYAWVPFGGGAHKCIGLHFAEMQVKSVLHQMLLRFRWRVPEGYEMPLDTRSLPVPADGLPVTLERV